MESVEPEGENSEGGRTIVKRGRRDWKRNTKV